MSKEKALLQSIVALSVLHENETGDLNDEVERLEREQHIQALNHRDQIINTKKEISHLKKVAENLNSRIDELFNDKQDLTNEIADLEKCKVSADDIKSTSAIISKLIEISSKGVKSKNKLEVLTDLKHQAREVIANLKAGVQ